MKRGFSIVAIGLLACLFNPTQAQTEVRNPREILTRMLNTYENVTSYEDVGVLRLIPQDSSRSHQQPLFPKQAPRTKLTFKTYYAAPRMLRFEWKRPSKGKPPRTSVVWANGIEAYSWQPNPALKSDRFVFAKKDTLAGLIQDSLKPSGGMVSTVPSLLIHDLLPYTFKDLVSDLTDLSLIKQEAVDGEPCFVIGGNVQGTPWLLWVGRESHFLRKIRSFYSIGSFHDARKRRAFVAEEIHRDIRVNHKIPASVFLYKPPLRRGDFDLTDK